ncbi:Uncharacterised protein [Mycobacteroides abscessus subsp. abscessus]|nr:Uncharacterised protein [Mycobacteroides abscessus subsp. abscessus]
MTSGSGTSAVPGREYGYPDDSRAAPRSTGPVHISVEVIHIIHNLIHRRPLSRPGHSQDGTISKHAANDDGRAGEIGTHATR